MTASRARGIIVSDAGPLIGLAKADSLEILRKLFRRVLIPPAVLDELQATSGKPGALQLAKALASGWVVPQSVSPAALSTLPSTLGPGETEALALAVDQNATILIDERHGRSVATKRGITLVGTAGLLIAAKRKGAIVRVAPTLLRLGQCGYRFSPALIKEVLRLAGEEQPNDAVELRKPDVP